MGLDTSMQLIMSGVLNITQLFGVASSLWTLDRFGRRTILLWGSAGMFVSHLGISILVGMFSSNWSSHRIEGWTSVAFLLFYMISFGASWGPVPWAMPAEIFPSSLRAKGVAISTCSSESYHITLEFYELIQNATDWLNNFIIVRFTPLTPHFLIFCTHVTGSRYTTTSTKHRIRCIRLLRSLLSRIVRMDVFFRSGNEREDT